MIKNLFNYDHYYCDAFPDTTNKYDQLSLCANFYSLFSYNRTFHWDIVGQHKDLGTCPYLEPSIPPPERVIKLFKAVYEHVSSLSTDEEFADYAISLSKSIMFPFDSQNPPIGFEGHVETAYEWLDNKLDFKKYIKEFLLLRYRYKCLEQNKKNLLDILREYIVDVSQDNRQKSVSSRYEEWVKGVKDNNLDRNKLFTDDTKPHNIVEYVVLKLMSRYSISRNRPHIDNTGKEYTRSQKCYKKIVNLYRDEDFIKIENFSTDEKNIIHYVIERISNINLLNTIHNKTYKSAIEKEYVQSLFYVPKNDESIFKVYDHQKALNPWYFLAIYPLVNLRIDLLEYIDCLLPEFIFQMVQYHVSYYLPFISHLFDTLTAMRTTQSEITNSYKFTDRNLLFRNDYDRNDETKEDRKISLHPNVEIENIENIYWEKVNATYPYSYTSTATEMFKLNLEVMGYNLNNCKIFFDRQYVDSVLQHTTSKLKENTFFHWSKHNYTLVEGVREAIYNSHDLGLIRFDYNHVRNQFEKEYNISAIHSFQKKLIYNHFPADNTEKASPIDITILNMIKDNMPIDQIIKYTKFTQASIYNLALMYGYTSYISNNDAPK